MRPPVCLGWKACLLLTLALALQSFPSPASGDVSFQTVPDVAVTAIAVPAGPVIQGNTVEIAVTIENLGSGTASVAVILNYIPAEGNPGNVGQKTEEVPAGTSTTVTFSWDTTGVPLGDYTFQAVALLDGMGDDNPSNDFMVTSTPLTITAAAEPEPVADVGVTAIEFPDGPVNQGNTVDITVTIENLGSADAPVMVILRYLNAEGAAMPVGTVTENVAAGASEDVTISWDTTGVPPGGYTFQAVAILEGEGEDVLGNNYLLTTDPITVGPPTYGVDVTALVVPAGRVDPGGVVDVDVTVENLGSVPAMFKVTLLFSSIDGKEGEYADEETVEIEAGADTEITLSWDTGEAQPGNYQLTAGAMPVGVKDVNVDDVLDFMSSTITVGPPAYDVAVTAIEVPDGPVNQGNTVDVTVTVENLGSSTASSVMVILSYLDADSAALSVGQKMQDVAAGTSEDVTFSWDTADVSPGSYKLQAVAILGGAEDAVPENDSFVTADPITVGPPTYGVDVTALVVLPGRVDPGDVVDVDVTVENLGSVPAMFKVTLLFSSIDGKEGEYADEETVEIEAGADTEITLSWDTGEAQPGNYQLTAGAMPVGVEGVNVDDVLDFMSSTITVGPPAYDVAVTAIEVPDGPVNQGNIVDITVTIENLVPVPDSLVDTGKSLPTVDSSLRGNDGQVKRVSGIRHIQVETVLADLPYNCKTFWKRY